MEFSAGELTLIHGLFCLLDVLMGQSLLFFLLQAFYDLFYLFSMRVVGITFEVLKIEVQGLPFLKGHLFRAQGCQLGDGGVSRGCGI